MYIEYETWLNVGDLVYRIVDLTIETWRIRHIGVTMDVSTASPESYCTIYHIEPVSHKNSYREMCFNQDSLQEKFCRDKKDLIQKLVGQL